MSDIEGSGVKQDAELDDGGYFEPFIPQVEEPPKYKPAPRKPERSLADLMDELLPTEGMIRKPAPETQPQASSAAEGAGDGEPAQPTETPSVPMEPPGPPPRMATPTELFGWITRSLLAQTRLTEEAAELIVFWIISTWFQDQLTILPCLVLTGSAHEAMAVLHVLHRFSRGAALLADFRRSHLGTILGRCGTVLISEPNLDKRTAGLLSNLTDRRFVVVEGGYCNHCSRFIAIYVGENPDPPKIQNSFHVHIAPTNAAPSAQPPWLGKMNKGIPTHLMQYRANNLDYVRGYSFTTTTLSSEAATIAAKFGVCVGKTPKLWNKLVYLLKTRDKERSFEMSNSAEAIVLEATRMLSSNDRECAYAREIAAEANRLLEARGEKARLSPEKVGHGLKKLGLCTQPLSQKGHGLRFNQASLARIQQLASMYGMEDVPLEAETLHG
jgi:hypothetical protein